MVVRISAWLSLYLLMQTYGPATVKCRFFVNGTDAIAEPAASATHSASLTEVSLKRTPSPTYTPPTRA